MFLLLSCFKGQRFKLVHIFYRLVGKQSHCNVAETDRMRNPGERGKKMKWRSCQKKGSDEHVIKFGWYLQILSHGDYCRNISWVDKMDFPKLFLLLLPFYLRGYDEKRERSHKSR